MLNLCIVFLMSSLVFIAFYIALKMCAIYHLNLKSQEADSADIIEFRKRSSIGVAAVSSLLDEASAIDNSNDIERFLSRLSRIQTINEDLIESEKLKCGLRKLNALNVVLKTAGTTESLLAAKTILDELRSIKQAHDQTTDNVVVLSRFSR